MMSNLIFLSSFFFSVVLTAISWFMLGVHYPLYGLINRLDFRKYALLQAQYSIAFVIYPMLADLLLAVVLLYIPSIHITSFYSWLSFILALTAWAATFSIRITMQQKLVKNGNGPENLKSLLLLHWMRTVSWTLRSGILFYFMYYAIA